MSINSYKTALLFLTAVFIFNPLFSQEDSSVLYTAGGVAGDSPAEGAADRTTAGRGPGSEGEASPLKEESDIYLDHLYSYIDSPAVEQRQVFTAKDIEDSHTESLVSFLQSEGMQLLSYGPYGLEAKPQIRGFTDETVRVVIDGICVNNAQYGTFDFTTISLGDIEKIEVVRGGFTEGVSDEGSVAGTIYITTKKQNLGTDFTSDTLIKSYLNDSYPADTFSQSAGLSHQLFENTFLKLNLKGTYALNKYQYKNYLSKYVTRDHAEVKDIYADAKVSHFFMNGSSFNTGLIFYDGVKNCPGSENSSGKGVQKDLNAMLTFSLLNPDIKNKVKMENNAAWIFNKRNYDESSTSSQHIINTFRYALYASSDIKTFYTQSAGLTFDGVFLDSTDDGNHTQLSFTFKETSVFKIGRHFSFTLPLAVKTCGDNAAFIPKAGVKFSFEYGDFSVNAYRMVQFPNMDDLYWDSSYASGNPDLKVEEGWGAEAAVDFKKYLPFTLSFFTNYYKNKIQWASTDGVYTPQNVASAFYWGLDFRTEKVLFDGHLHLKACGEYLYTSLLDKSNSLTYKKRIMWTPDWTASASAVFYFYNFRTGIEWNYIGKRYKSNLNITYMEPYSLVNLNLSYEGLEHFEPYLRAENIFDTDYEAVDSYPMPGISISLGLRSRWKNK
ncbi:TonB-dependent siderophore receptor [Treponema sp.]|uniref:TonB-dependent receptor plug domain-containing protein n=1 Tax=Treponema sp. TaxID=166 RepID=UPI0025D1F403|nr:TonB-dependent receptor plug domain-containing protein [Treponema sp.]MCR5218523.1 TonB-dependent receptor [Treponema sp.]